MFTKAGLGRVWWPVTLTQYDEAGELVETTIRLLFEPYTRAQRAARQKAVMQRASEAMRDLREDTDLGRPADDNATAERIGEAATDRVIARMEEAFAAGEQDIAEVIARTHDWRGPQEGDKEIPFDPDLLADLMAWDAFAKPVLEAFNACCEGAVRKNSGPGHAGKPAPAQGAKSYGAVRA